MDRLLRGRGWGQGVRQPLTFRPGEQIRPDHDGVHAPGARQILEMSRFCRAAGEPETVFVDAPRPLQQIQIEPPPLLGGMPGVQPEPIETQLPRPIQRGLQREIPVGYAVAAQRARVRRVKVVIR